MAKLTYYRQKRHDGGIRSGIEADGHALWHHYHEPAIKQEIALDSALLWYVDLDFEGEDVPTAADVARQWLLNHSDALRTWLQGLSDEIRAGFDQGIFPLVIRRTDVVENVELSLRLSAMKRIGAREMVAAVEELGNQWERRVDELSLPAFA